MSRHAKVDVRVWDDEKVKRMTPIPACGQGLWIRLLVSRHRTTVPGILCVGEAALAEEFGWTLEAFREAFAEAFREGLVKADWKSRIVWIPNAFKFNSPENPNVVKSWRIPWDETPECQLKVEAYSWLKESLKGFSEGFRKAFVEACSDPSRKGLANQEQEQEQEQKGSPSARDPMPLAGSTESGSKIRPRTAHDLKHLLRVAVERHQPKNGMWNPGGSFADRDARVFLEGFDDLEAALEDIERRIELFARDPDMAPWTVEKFSKRYNGIGQARASPAQRQRDPKVGRAVIDQPQLKPGEDPF